MRASHLVIMVGLFNCPKGNHAWLKSYTDPDTPLDEALEHARTRPNEACRMYGGKKNREIDKYADSIIASGDWTCYTELVP